MNKITVQNEQVPASCKHVVGGIYLDLDFTGRPRYMMVITRSTIYYSFLNLVTGELKGIFNSLEGMDKTYPNDVLVTSPITIQCNFK